MARVMPGPADCPDPSDTVRRFTLAIQRVCEIHRPVEYTVPGVRVVIVCMECRLHSARVPYPCRTIQALGGAA